MAHPKRKHTSYRLVMSESPLIIQEGMKLEVHQDTLSFVDGTALAFILDYLPQDPVPHRSHPTSSPPGSGTALEQSDRFVGKSDRMGRDRNMTLLLN